VIRVPVSRLPLAKELADFDFSVSPVNAALLRDLRAGGLLSPLIAAATGDDPYQRATPKYAASAWRVRSTL